MQDDVEDLLQAAGLLIRRLRREGNVDGLSLSQISVLAHLERNDALTTADLARIERVKPQSMGATVAALEGEGLIERRPHPTDGRQVLFALTSSGVAMRQKSKRLKRAWLEAAIARLAPDEQKTLIAAISLIRRVGEDEA